MTLRQYLFLMTACTVLSWAAWVLIIFFASPEAGGPAGIVFFYASLGLALTGTNAIVGLLLRTRWNKAELISRLAATSFRQAIWFALVIVIALILQSFLDRSLRSKASK